MDTKNLNQDENQNEIQQEAPEQSLSQQQKQEPIPQPAQEEEKFVLVIKNKTNGSETVYTLKEDEEIIIGASPDSDSAVCVEDPYISSRHFSAKLKNGNLEVEDLKSTNGLYKLLDKPARISPEEILLAGRTTFKFEKRTGNAN